MYESYQKGNEVYYVIEDNGVVLGGGGVKPLNDFEDDVCEIQNVFFLPKIREKGYGKLLFEKCMQAAKILGYKQCYLESAFQLKVAIYMYESFGFRYLNKALGNTGHYSCGVWMIKKI